MTINPRIALSLASIVAATSLGIGATFAFFSDTSTSSGNVLGATTMALELSDNNEAFGNDSSQDVTLSFNSPSMVPGDSVAQEIGLKNTGGTSIAEIAFGTTTSATSPSGGDIRNKLNMQVVVGGTASGNTCTGGTDITGTLATIYGGTSPLTLAELSGNTYDSLAIALAPNASSTVCVGATFDSTADNTFQGSQANIDFSFTAHQDTSQ